MKKLNLLSLLFSFLFLLLACERAPIIGSNENVLVEYNGEKLTKQDIQKILPETYTSEDSVIIVEAYIKRWLQKKITVQNATQNISAEELQNLDQQIKDYREDLILNKFYNQRLEKLNENTLSEDEMKQYYESNKESFILNENIVKVKYIITNKDQQETLAKLFSENDSVQLATYVSQHSNADSYLKDQWMSFSQLQSQLNLPEDFGFQTIQKKSFLQYEKNNKYYTVKFYNSMPKETTGPYEYFKNTIKSILFNKRKLNLQKQIEDSLYDNAVKNNKINYHE